MFTIKPKAHKRNNSAKRVTFCKHLKNKTMCAVCVHEANEGVFLCNFKERLMWNFRFQSILMKMDEKDAMVIAKRVYVEMRGRQPAYGTELFMMANATRDCIKAIDMWVPDAFQIWQEETFDQEFEDVMGDLKAVDEAPIVTEDGRRSVRLGEAVEYPSAPVLKPLSADLKALNVDEFMLGERFPEVNLPCMDDTEECFSCGA